MSTPLGCVEHWGDLPEAQDADASRAFCRRHTEDSISKDNLKVDASMAVFGRPFVRKRSDPLSKDAGSSFDVIRRVGDVVLQRCGPSPATWSIERLWCLVGRESVSICQCHSYQWIHIRGTEPWQDSIAWVARYEDELPMWRRCCFFLANIFGSNEVWRWHV